MRDIIIFFLILFVITLSLACCDLNDRMVLLEKQAKVSMETKR